MSNFDEDFTNERNYLFLLLEPVNSLVASDVLLLSKFEKEFEGLDFNRTKDESSA